MSSTKWQPSCLGLNVLKIRPLGTNPSEILIVTQTFSLTKMYLKMSSAKCFHFFWASIGLASTAFFLTHCGLVTSYGDKDPGQPWLR